MYSTQQDSRGIGYVATFGPANKANSKMYAGVAWSTDCGTTYFQNAAGTTTLSFSSTAMSVPGTLNVVGNFSVATNKFTVAAASGNTVIAGTLSTTGVPTFASGTATPAGGSTAARILIGSASIGVYIGSGAPTVSAAKGSFYMRSDGSSSSTRLYVNTDGATTWTNVTTAA